MERRGVFPSIERNPEHQRRADHFEQEPLYPL